MLSKILKKTIAVMLKNMQLSGEMHTKSLNYLIWMQTYTIHRGIGLKYPLTLQVP